jgi:SRSO17 transposase
MTTFEVRAAAGVLLNFHERFAPLFGRPEARRQSLIYLQGLLLAEGRKSVEPMALVFGAKDQVPADRQDFEQDGAEDVSACGQNQVLALQRFLTYSPWQANDVQRELQTVFAEELAPTATQWPLGVVGVIDESGFPKKGKASVGVARQHCGRLGKVDNCQVGVFLVGVAPAGTVLLDQQLYLPKDWAKDRKRRRHCRVPKEVRFRTKCLSHKSV